MVKEPRYTAVLLVLHFSVGPNLLEAAAATCQRTISGLLPTKSPELKLTRQSHDIHALLD